jgi:hypothetical protein
VNTEESSEIRPHLNGWVTPLEMSDDVSYHPLPPHYRQQSMRDRALVAALMLATGCAVTVVAVAAGFLVYAGMRLAETLWGFLR